MIDYFQETLQRADQLAIRDVHPNDTMFLTGKSWYYSVGLSALRTILRSAALSNLGTVSSILDLPCGHGRVGRFLRSAFPESEISFCDLDKEGVDFCARTFSGTPIYSVPELTEVQFPARFDLIWCGSLLTHIDRDRFSRWLPFLCSLLNENGVLVATTHGPFLIEGGKSVQYIHSSAWQHILDQYALTGYGYADYDKPGFTNYGVSLSRPSLVVSMVEDIQGVRLLSYTERGWSNHQDVVCIAKTDRMAPWGK